jgi:hypothetical protein
VRNSRLVYSGIDDNVERSRPVPSRLTVFFAAEPTTLSRQTTWKIDQLMPIVAEIEQIPWHKTDVARLPFRVRRRVQSRHRAEAPTMVLRARTLPSEQLVVL